MHEWEWRCRKPFQSIFWSCLCPTEATRFQRPWASLERVVKRRFFDAATWPCLCQLLQPWHPFASPYPTYPLDWRGQSGAEGDRFALIKNQVPMGLFPGAAKKGGALRKDPAPKSLLWPPNAGLSSAKGWRTNKMGSCATTQFVWQYSQYSKKRGPRRGDLATPNPNCIKLFMRRTKKQRKKRAGFQHVWQLLPLNPTWTWLKKSTFKRSLFDTDSFSN